jgi:hypothetical protein
MIGSDLERSSEFYKKMLEPLGIDMPYKFDQLPQRGFAINAIVINSGRMKLRRRLSQVRVALDESWASRIFP